MDFLHVRNDQLVGEQLNKYFKRAHIDYTEYECWYTNGLLWGLHSCLEYESNMISKFGVELTIMSEGGHVTKKMIKHIGSTIFEDSRYERLTALISPDNKLATKFVKVVGFTHEGTLRGVDRGKDTDIYSIFEEEYRSKWKDST